MNYFECAYFDQTYFDTDCVSSSGGKLGRGYIPFDEEPPRNDDDLTVLLLLSG